MIKIEKTVNADSRTATGTPTKETLLEESLLHIEHVQKGMDYFAERLIEAGGQHDHTKIEHIDEFWEDFSSGKTGEEFKEGKWFQKHLRERHHLQDRCPEDVNLIDVMEELVDKVMAGMARSGEVNMKYFDVDKDRLEKAYLNTIQLLEREIEIAE